MSSETRQLRFEELVEHQLVGLPKETPAVLESLNIVMLVEPDKVKYSHILDFYRSIFLSGLSVRSLRFHLPKPEVSPPSKTDQPLFCIAQPPLKKPYLIF